MEDEIKIFTEAPLVYAGFWERFAASFIDAIILCVVYLCNLFLFGDLNRELNVGFSLANMLVTIVYFAAFESSARQGTFGKQAMRLKVTDMNGNRISFLNAIGRYLGKFLSQFILFIGYLMMIWDDKKQCLHDRLARTLVVKSPA